MKITFDQILPLYSKCYIIWHYKLFKKKIKKDTEFVKKWIVKKISTPNVSKVLSAPGNAIHSQVSIHSSNTTDNNLIEYRSNKFDLKTNSMFVDVSLLTHTVNNDIIDLIDVQLGVKNFTHGGTSNWPISQQLSALRI